MRINSVYIYVKLYYKVYKHIDKEMIYIYVYVHVTNNIIKACPEKWFTPLWAQWFYEFYQPSGNLLSNKPVFLN